MNIGFHIQRRDELDLGYEIFIAAISVLSVFNMILVDAPRIYPVAVNVVIIINVVLTILFVYDFGLRFLTAPSRSFYFFRNFGWADLLAIIPALRIFRLFRIYKAYRIVHKHGAKFILNYLSRNRAASALYILVLMVILIIEFGSILVLQVEQGSPSANITSATDAIWWAYVTITTVGYGDQFPVTNAGRLVGIMVMTTGVAVFATFAGLISSKLLASPPKEEEKPEVTAEGDEVARYRSELKQLISERERIETEIAGRLDKLDKLLAEPSSG